MARQKNDGRGRLGGRAKGTPNKTTSTLKGWINELLEENRELFNAHLVALDSGEFVKAYMALMAYVVPKEQALNIEARIKQEYEELESLLQKCPESLLDKLTDRLINLQNQTEDAEQGEED